MMWYIYIAFLQYLFYGSTCAKYNEKSDKNLRKTWTLIPNDEGKLFNATIVGTPEPRMFISVGGMMEYTLFTRENTSGEVIKNYSLEGSTFRSERPTKIITHGWKSNGRRTVCQEIKEAYMEEGDYNIFILDWNLIAMGPYVGAVFLVDEMGLDLAKFADSVICQGSHPKSIHMIGHSIGAHLVGVAGRQLKEERVYRVTGLDPAGPLFDTNAFGLLGEDSADFVDVIHTSTSTVGYTKPLGTVDFYPNGGGRQPYCIYNLLGAIGCDHAASWKYFKASILDKTKYIASRCPSFAEFQENKCDDQAYMGEAVSNTARGIYYLTATES